MSDADERDEAKDEAGFDPESRRLCADDTCTGVIGPDGKCKVCGKEPLEGAPSPAASTAAEAEAAEAPAAEAQAAEPDEGTDEDPEVAAAGEAEASDFDP